MSASSSTDSLILLISELELQDVRSLQAAQKGKKREGVPLSDPDLALSLSEALLRTQIQIHRDRKIARSLARASNLDGDVLDVFQEEEQQAERDREMAVRLSRPNSARASRVGSVAGSPLMSRRDSGRSTPAPGPSKQSETSSPPSPGPMPQSFAAGVPSATGISHPEQTQQRQQCAACTEAFLAKELIRVPCQHVYCAPCLKDLFLTATRDEELMPPRCCRQLIALELLRGKLSLRETTLFRTKEREFGTVNRLYCPAPSCATFIGGASDEAGTTARCPSCGLGVCSYCKTLQHAGPCTGDTDPESQNVLALGEREGWRRCSKCRTLVELALGCFHMTCRCRHQFCYVCGESWKTCECPQWEERRLLIAAEERVGAEREGLRPLAAPAFAARVAEAAINLRANHECNHGGGFRYHGVNGNCAWCGHRLIYLFRCGDCALRVCNRCRRNRVY